MKCGTRATVEKWSYSLLSVSGTLVRVFRRFRVSIIQQTYMISLAWRYWDTALTPQCLSMIYRAGDRRVARAITLIRIIIGYSNDSHYESAGTLYLTSLSSSNIHLSEAIHNESFQSASKYLTIICFPSEKRAHSKNYPVSEIVYFWT